MRKVSRSTLLVIAVYHIQWVFFGIILNWIANRKFATQGTIPEIGYSNFMVGLQDSEYWKIHGAANSASAGCD
jgi:hypothetical protein